MVEHGSAIKPFWLQSEQTVLFLVPDGDAALLEREGFSFLAEHFLFYLFAKEAPLLRPKKELLHDTAMMPSPTQALCCPRRTQPCDQRLLSKAFASLSRCGGAAVDLLEMVTEVWVWSWVTKRGSLHDLLSTEMCRRRPWDQFLTLF